MGKSDSLYKYTRLEFVGSCLNHGIYASSFTSLNDPYESEEADSHNDFRVICLSRSKNQKLMWSHYANGHRGCSLKIALPDDYGTPNCPFKRVEYKGSHFSRHGLSDDDYYNSLYIKDKKWSKELEVRGVYCPANANQPCWKKYRNNVYYRAKILQIDFGCLAHTDSHYLDALIAMRDFNSTNKRKITVRKYMMSDSKYLFLIDNSYDYEKEIDKIVSKIP